MAETASLNGYSRPNTRERGTSGLPIVGGRLQDEFQREWQETRKARTIRGMMTDPYVSRSLWTFELLIRNVDWSFEAAGEDADSRFGADFASEVLFDDQSQSWDDALSDHLTMVQWGWAWHELVWKKRLGTRSRFEPGVNSKFSDGKWGLRKTVLRGQDTLDRWVIDEQGGIQGMVQRDQYAGKLNPEPLSIADSLLFRLSRHRNSPEGRSLLRAAWIPWYSKVQMSAIQGIGAERDLAGLPALYIPRDVLEKEQYAAIKREYERMGRDIRQDEQGYVLLPSERDDKGNRLYELELLASPGSKQFDTQAIIQGLNKDILIALMTDIVLIGHEGVGSLALHSSATELLSFGLGGLMDSIAEVYNRHFMPRLWRFNGLPDETMPTLIHGDVEQVNLTELGDFITKMSVPFDISDLENEVRRQAGLPLKDEDLIAAEQELRETQQAAFVPPEPTDPGEPAPEEEEAA